MTDYKNYFPTVGGRLYRVALTRGGRALIAVGRFNGRDIGRPLMLDGVLGRKVIKAAKELVGAKTVAE